MSILSTNRKLIKVGQDYSAGSGIGIYDHVISVTGEFGKTYSAGNNVDIYEQDEQLYISSKDWTNDIANASANAYNEAVAQIPDPFDPSYLSAQIDNKLNSSDFTTWQNGQYNTDLQTIESQINNKLDTSSFSDVSGSFLTAHQSLDGYATENWVTAQGYITGVDLSPYYTTAEANSLSSMLSGAIDYVSANADNVEVTNVVQSNSGVWNEVTNKLDATAFSNVSGSFYTNDNPSGFITGVDLSNYYTKDETSGKEELANAFDNIPVGDPEVNAYVTNNSASLNGTTDLVQNSSGLWNDVAVYQSNSANYLTAHQDISYKLDESAFADVSGTFLTAINIPESASWEEATQAYEQNSGTYLTAHQSLDGYATEDWVTGQGYITGVEIPESATWNEVSTTVQTNSSNWDNVTNKLDTTAFSDVSGTFLTAHQAISADEWNDCYDNVNTNSGAWGGSALPISAGPGIKVNLVDNTLVFSNDETVLWNGENLTIGSTATLSETVKNFELFGIYGHETNRGRGVYQEFNPAVVVNANTQSLALFLPDCSPEMTWAGWYIENLYFTDTAATALVNVSGRQTWRWYANNTWEDGGAERYIQVDKIVGINRIAGGN